MNKFLFIIALFVCSCKSEPDTFLINDKLYTTKKVCVKEELVHKFYGPLFVQECVEWKVDTIEFKK